LITKQRRLICFKGKVTGDAGEIRFQ